MVKVRTLGESSSDESDDSIEIELTFSKKQSSKQRRQQPQLIEEPRDSAVESGEQKLGSF